MKGLAPMTLKHRSPVVLLAAILACFSAGAAAAEKAKITSPKEEFGFQLGDDYCLANYQQLSAYWRKLARPYRYFPESADRPGPPGRSAKDSGPAKTQDGQTWEMPIQIMAAPMPSLMHRPNSLPQKAPKAALRASGPGRPRMSSTSMQPV